MAVSPEAFSPATAAYLTGLDALAAAKWVRAIDAFTAAINADPGDDPAYYRARGVASTPAERFQPAIDDLRWANQLDPTDSETRIWLPPIMGYEPVLKPRYLAGVALAKMFYARGDAASALAILPHLRGPNYDASQEQEIEQLWEMFSQPR